MSAKSAAPRDWAAHPPLLAPDYKSTVLRAPQQHLIPLKSGLSELTGPAYDGPPLGELDGDLTRNGRRNGEPLGERIIVTGRILDEAGNPVPQTLVEIWQANAAGRYVHVVDQHDAPLDPNFIGAGRCLTDDTGSYRFLTVKPGAYSWRNHPNAWRPNHIHFSLLGPAIASRLVTQMYFPGDPLLEYDSIFRAVPESARDRLVARFSLEATQPEFAMGFVFDIVLRGRQESTTPFEARG
jgi:protocatechuate 3,4-dioxygenase beta subunit